MQAPRDRYEKVGQFNTRYWAEGDHGSTGLLLHGVGVSIKSWLPRFVTLARECRLSAVSALLALLAGLLAVTQPVRAATYIVANTNDSGPGSLRQAITDAYNNPGPDTITFSAATNGTAIVLAGAAGEDANASGDLDILDGGDLIIQGNGVANTIIDGGGTDRVFHVCPEGGCTHTVTLAGVTIRNGTASGHGGAIYNKGATTLDGSTVSGNTATYSGGGIFNTAAATLNVQNGSTIGGAGASNTADDDGGGIYNSTGGSTTVDGSIISANGADRGGGIYNNGMLTIQNSTIGGAGAANTADMFGGGIYHEKGTTTLIGSTVSANSATNGGGIYNLATLTIQSGSTIGGAGASNTASVEGGGIYVTSGAVTTVTDSTVSANMAGWGGGIFNQATLTVENSTIGGAGAGNTATTSGGGIYNLAGMTTLDGSTVSDNTATLYGGGIYAAAGATIVDGSIVSDNTASSGGGIYNKATPLNVQNGSIIGGAGAGNQVSLRGGGIYNEQGIATVDGSTVSANTATGTFSEGGGIYNKGTVKVQNGSTIGGAGAGNTADGGGGIYNFIGGTVLVDGSTVSANTAIGGGGIYSQGTLTVQNGSTIGGAGAGNTAAYSGGGIYNGSGGAATVTGSRILANTADDGGGVCSNCNINGATNVTGSCIVRNSDTSFLNKQPAQQNASGNWWGAATGPNTPGADTVDGNVQYDGFLTEPILGCVFYVYLPLVLRAHP